MHLDAKCGRVFELVSVYLIPMFCGGSIPHSLRQNTNIKIIIKTIFLTTAPPPPFAQNLAICFITNTVRSITLIIIVDQSINLLQSEVSKARQTVFYRLYFNFQLSFKFESCCTWYLLKTRNSSGPKRV